MKQQAIINALNYYFPNPKCELFYTKDYELVLAVMLSAQTTDKKVNKVTSVLFKEYDSLEKLNILEISDIEEKIKSIGLYKNKSKNFKGIVIALINNGNLVPNNREFLENLPGIGRKSTNVILSELYNEPCIAVDTHVSRISKRLGISFDEDNVIIIENKLMKYFPKNLWSRIHYQIVLFGRYRCMARKPMCTECLLQNHCKYYKEKTSK